MIAVRRILEAAQVHAEVAGFGVVEQLGADQPQPRRDAAVGVGRVRF